MRCSIILNGKCLVNMVAFVFLAELFTCKNVFFRPIVEVDATVRDDLISTFFAPKPNESICPFPLWSLDMSNILWWNTASEVERALNCHFRPNLPEKSLCFLTWTVVVHHTLEHSLVFVSSVPSWDTTVSHLGQSEIVPCIVLPLTPPVLTTVSS